MSKKLFTDTRKYNNCRPIEKEINLFLYEKNIIIKCRIDKYKLKNMVSYFCKISGVSRCGYYK